jgi:hypothetical protein
MRCKGFSPVNALLVSALFNFSFPSVTAAQDQGYFPIGVWCTEFPLNAQGEISPTERDLITDLGITYLIACPGGLDGEEAIMHFCNDEITAGRRLHMNIDNDPYDSQNSLWSDWGRYADVYVSGNEQDSLAWVAGVRDILTNINTGWAFQDGFGDAIIISGESGAEDPDHWPGLNFMCELIDSLREATGSRLTSLYQIGLHENVPDIISNVDMDVFLTGYYPFVEDLDTSGTAFQDSIQSFVSSVQTPAEAIRSKYETRVIST